MILTDEQEASGCGVVRLMPASSSPTVQHGDIVVLCPPF